ncbi:hypothetical protein [Microlunatus ginsengisoli]
MTNSQMTTHADPASRPDTAPRWLRLFGAALMPIGPAVVAIIRLIYPPDAATALHQPQTMEAVLWLGFVATFTLIPGAYAALTLLRRPTPRLWIWTGAFLLPGYLAMMTLGFGDTLWAAAPAAGLDVDQAESLSRAAEAAGPGSITLLIFVLGHVVGATLLGVAALRGRLIPVASALAMIISQPLHVVAVITAAPVLDLVAWGLTATSMGFLAIRYVRAGD